MIEREFAKRLILTVLVITLPNLKSFSQSVQEFISLALDLDAEEKYEQALSTYNTAIGIYPKEPMLHVLKGELLGKLNLGNESAYNKALKEFEFALELDSTFFPAYSSRGILNLTYQKYESAIKDFTHVLRLAKGDDDKQFNALGDRANAKLYRKDYNGAIEDYKQALKIRPNDLKTKINLGVLYVNLKEFDDARELFEMALDKDPKNIDALNNLATLYIIEKKPKKAIPILEKAIEIYPKESDLYSNLGLAKIKIGQPKDGLTLINRSLSLSANDPYAYKHRAMAYLELDKIEEACNDLFRANQLGYSISFDNEVNEMISKYCKGGGK